MKASLCVAVAALALPLTADTPEASGSLGIYAIVERVVLEPNEQTPTRVRLHGAFAFVNGGVDRPLGVTTASRGFVRFILPSGIGEEYDRSIVAIRKEWIDLKAVAGTGQAVGFGSWGYLGGFTAFKSDGRGSAAPRILIAGYNEFGEFRVSAPADSLNSLAAVYQTNVGVVKLTEGSHASVINMLRQAMR